MTSPRVLAVAALVFGLALSPVLAQQPAQAVVQPTADELQAIAAKIVELDAALAPLKASTNFNQDLVADAEANLQVVKNLIRNPDEFFDNRVASRAVSILNDGLRRAKQIADGTANWHKLTGRVHRGTRSKVDGTAQPYRVTIPSAYDGSQPVPLVVYLHGRGNTDLGMGWVGGNDQPAGGGRGGAAAANPLEPIQLQCFGRANNSFRFAGEEDVLLAIDAVRRQYNIDPNRIVLRGFSMGSAGGYQIGMHQPDMFCALELNAGVIGTRTSLEGISPVERAAASIYGITVDHALNIADIPYVGFAGENDAQLRASTSIREKLVTEGFQIDQLDPLHWKGVNTDKYFLVNPGAGHAHPRGTVKQSIDDYVAKAMEQGRKVPDRVRYVTYNTRFNSSHWVTVDGLEEHYSRALVDAVRNADHTQVHVTTKNISRLTLADAAKVRQLQVDGQSLEFAGAPMLKLWKNGGKWVVANTLREDARLRKQHGLQGPIDDAFFDSFLCVTGSSTPWNPLAEERAAAELKWFDAQFNKVFRGEVRRKADTAVTEADIAASNLVLFGDPGSNALLAKVIGQLPIKWTKDTITVAGKEFPAGTHVPVLIYPNPLNPKRYVVLNIGQSQELRGRASAQLGDVAVLKLEKNEAGEFTNAAAFAAVFNEAWELP